MAFFSEHSKIDNEESLNYLSFHGVCGKSVNFGNERRTAEASGPANGIVYSAKPIPTGGMFQVKVVERGNYAIVSITS